MIRRLAISTEHGAEFWQIGADVYRAPLNASLDIYGHPMSKRFEASLQTWERFRQAVFGWAQDIQEAR